MAKFTELQLQVRKFMELEVPSLLALPFGDGERTATHLAELAAWEFDPEDTWLDDETHWVWEFALDFWPEGE